MLHLRLRQSDGTIVSRADVATLPELAAGTANLLWLDLQSPTPEEVRLVAASLAWEELTVEDLTKQRQRAKIEAFDHYTLLVMHDLDFDRHATPQLTIHEVDFITGPNYVASVHYHPLEHIGSMQELDSRLRDAMGRGADYLLYSLIDGLVDGFFPVLDDMHEAVEDLEQSIVANPNRDLLERIFVMKRDAVILRRVMSPQLEVFSRLTSPAFGIVREENVMYMRDVHDHLIRTYESVDTYRDLMSDALSAYLSNVSNRLSDVMKRLTVVASLFLPISFFTGLMGMNLRDAPTWDDPLFWLIVGGLIAFTLAQILYYKSKGWV